jgi:hypothetical protein
MTRIATAFCFKFLASVAAAQVRVQHARVEIMLGYTTLVKQANPVVVNICARIVTRRREQRACLQYRL